MAAGRLLSWAALLSGALALAYAGLQGDLEVHVLVLVPVVSGTGPWAVFGILLVMAGLVGLYLTAWAGTAPPEGGAPPGPGAHAHADGPEHGGPPGPFPEGTLAGTGRSERKSGGLVLIGPIPIAWGSDKPSLLWALGLGVVLTLAAVGLFLALRG